MSCLFQSLGTYEASTPRQMRAAICDHLASDPMLAGRRASVWIAELDPKDDLERYVSRMRRPNTWGGAVEIMAYCGLHGTNVQVRHEQHGGTDTISFVTPGATETAVLHWTGGHYTAVYGSKVCVQQQRMRLRPHRARPH